MADDTLCCCGCIILIFLVFAGFSLLGGSTENYDDSYDPYEDDEITDIDESDDYSDEYDEDNADESYSSNDLDDSSSSVSYVGSKNSDKYHDPSCSQAHRIKDGNKITFSSSKNAENLGYEACQHCNP